MVTGMGTGTARSLGNAHPPGQQMGLGQGTGRETSAVTDPAPRLRRPGPGPRRFSDGLSRALLSFPLTGPLRQIARGPDRLWVFRDPGGGSFRRIGKGRKTSLLGLGELFALLGSRSLKVWPGCRDPHRGIDRGY